MLQTLFYMWKDGMVIMAGMIVVMIGVIVVTAALMFGMDLLCAAIFDEDELIICKTFLPKKMYNKIKKYFLGKE